MICVGSAILDSTESADAMLKKISECDLVIDATADPNVRTYQTTERQHFHTDSCDIVGLLCLKTAKSGGLPSIT